MPEAGLTGRPLKILFVTHSMNVDDDAIVCLHLLSTFFDPAQRAIAWQPQLLRTCVETARYGDTTLFGGVDLDCCDPATMSDSEHLALAILRLINEAKEELVASSKAETALAYRNVTEACDLLVRRGYAKSPQQALEHLQEIAQRRAETNGECLLVARDNVLRGFLGKYFLAPAQIDADVRKKMCLDQLEDPEIRAACLSWGRARAIAELLPRDEIRAAFIGKKQSDFFGLSHEPYWNLESIGHVLSSIADRIPSMISAPKEFDSEVQSFIAKLTYIRTLAQRQTVSVEGKIAVTTSDDRIDRDPALAQRYQPNLIHDWLAAASASMGTEWLHVNDVRGAIIISGRFAVSGERRPEVNLAEPRFIQEFMERERACASAASKSSGTSEKPVVPLIKANVILSFTKLHVSKEEVLALLLKHYDSIVSEERAPATAPEYAQVRYADGSYGPFDGAQAFIRARAVH